MKGSLGIKILLGVQEEKQKGAERSTIWKNAHGRVENKKDQAPSSCELRLAQTNIYTKKFLQAPSYTSSRVLINFCILIYV